MATLDKRALKGTRQYLIQQGIALSHHADETEICQSLFRYLVANRGDTAIWKGLEASIRQTGCIDLKLCCKKDREASLEALISGLDQLKTSLPESDTIQGYGAFRHQLAHGLLSIFFLASVSTTGCYDADKKDSVFVGDTQEGSTEVLTTDDSETAIPNESDSESDSESEALQTEPQASDSESEALQTEPSDSESEDIPIEIEPSDTDSEIEDTASLPLDTESTCDQDIEACDESDPLQRTVENACMTSSKQQMCELLSTLNEDWQQGLYQLFENGTPEEIAEALDHLSICAEYAEYNTANIFDSPYNEDVATDIKEERLCYEFIPIYIIAAVPPVKLK